jgi:hypothetical protein
MSPTPRPLRGPETSSSPQSSTSLSQQAPAVGLSVSPDYPTNVRQDDATHHPSTPTRATRTAARTHRARCAPSAATSTVVAHRWVLRPATFNRRGFPDEGDQDSCEDPTRWRHALRCVLDYRARVGCVFRDRLRIHVFVDRRDIVMAWRGTITRLEWVDNQIPPMWDGSVVPRPQREGG